MESEPFKLTLKGKVDAKKLGDDFSKELGIIIIATAIAFIFSP